MTDHTKPEDHGWARDLLVRGFEERIKRYLTVDRIRERIEEKNSFSDILYEAMLLGGAGREHYVSMLTYWSIGQGIAVLLRQWIEELLKELVLHPENQGHFGGPIVAVYILRDLKQYSYRTDSDSLALAGETNTEHSQARRWDVRVRSGLVSAAQGIAKSLAFSYMELPAARRPRVPLNTGRGEQPRSSEPKRQIDEEREILNRQALGPGQPGYEIQRLICNLVVLEKPPGKVRAFRFASPGLASIRGMRDEKQNLLMLYGWIRQEKPFRLAPDAVEVYWAHLFPRNIAPVQRHFFAKEETWDSSHFWDYVGVPFDVVRQSLEASGRMLHRHIGQTIRSGAFDSVGKQLKGRQGLF